MARWTDGLRPWRGALLSLACLLAALGAIMLASGCGGADDDNTTSTAARRVVQVKREPTDRWTFARARFNEMCAGCHTLRDAGARGGRFDLDHGAGTEEAHVRYAIAEGEPGMPRWKEVLSTREFEELVAYISTVAERSPGDDRWQRQIRLRSRYFHWDPGDTRRLEAYARRLGEVVQP